MGIQPDIMTRQEIDQFVQIHDRLKGLVEDVIFDYCKILGHDYGYGTERFEINSSSVHVVLDTSTRGCYDYETHDIPLEWLSITKEERQKAMHALRQQEDEEKRKSRERYERTELVRLKEKVAELENKQSNKEP